jgi:hypothetical protein
MPSLEAQPLATTRWCALCLDGRPGHTCPLRNRALLPNPELPYCPVCGIDDGSGPCSAACEKAVRR